MKKLTKAQRHEVYVKALEYYYYNNIEGSILNVGLCRSLQKALESLCIYDEYFYPYEHMEQFPEIIKHKKNIRKRGYWWPEENMKPRIEVLKQAIEETKPTK